MNLKSEIEMRKELNACNNIAQAFDVLKKYYELENCKPQMFVKAQFVAKIGKSMKDLGAQPRRQYQ